MQDYGDLMFWTTFFVGSGQCSVVSGQLAVKKMHKINCAINFVHQIIVGNVRYKRGPKKLTKKLNTQYRPLTTEH